MNRQFMCLAALAIGTFLVVNTGCDGISGVSTSHEVKELRDKIVAEKGEQTKTGLEHQLIKEQARTVEGKKRFEEETILERARIQLAAVQMKRDDLENMANNFRTQYEQALLNIELIEKKKKEDDKEFVNLQKIARENGLPEFADAKEEDKAKMVQVGQGLFTGEQIYLKLKSCKAKSKKAYDAIERERTLSGLLNDRVKKICTRIDDLDNSIKETERQIAEVEMYTKFIEANKIAETSGEPNKTNVISSSQADPLSQLERLNTALAAELKIEDDKAIPDDIERENKKEVKEDSSYSITDDDLV